MSIYIVRSRALYTHYVVRLMPEERALSVNADDNLVAVNALLSAKSHKQMIEAIDLCPMLYNNRDRQQHNRIMTPDEALAALDSDFTTCNAKVLGDELHLYSPTPLRAYSSKKSPAADLDAYANNFRQDLLEARSKTGMIVVVEPVSDWVTFRNLLSLCAVLMGEIEQGEHTDDILRKVGFEYNPSPTYVRDPIFKIPLVYDPVGQIMIRAALSPFSRSPRYESLSWLLVTDSEREHQGTFITTRGVGGDSSVFFLTRYAANDDFFFRPLIAPLDRDLLYSLCITSHGTQLEMAKTIVAACWNAFMNLHGRDGVPFGKEVKKKPASNTSVLFATEEEADEIVFHSFASRAWDFVCMHSPNRLTICNWCGNARLSQNKGPVPRFCNESCRVQEAKSKQGDTQND